MTSTHGAEPDDFVLQSVFAFSIVQQKRVEQSSFVQPSGGLVRLTSKLKELVEAAFGQIQPSKLSSVDFDFTEGSSHPLRNNLMTVTFGTEQRIAAAEEIASRLSSRMDNRSRAGLLLATVEVCDPARRVSLLLLPREDVIHLNSTRDVELELLKDAFPSKSDVRKFARAEGHRSPTQFLSAQVFDVQRTGDKDSADYWVRDFLLARPRISAASGSRLLSSALRRAFDAATGGDREAVIAAMLKARSGFVRKTSLTTYANEELPPKLHDSYLRGVPEQARSAIFVVNSEVMQEMLGRRIFETEDGVIVSAPTDTVGKSVKIEDQGRNRMLSYAGVISKERVQDRGRR